MSHETQQEIEIDLPASPASKAVSKGSLTIKKQASQPLTPAQEEFNKQMIALEKARVAHERKRARLEKDLVVCRNELMPLVEMKHREEYHMIFLVSEARGSIKLTERRREALGNLLSDKMASLLEDPVGLSEEEFAALEELYNELNPPDEDNDEDDEQMSAEFEELRAMLEGAARSAGVELDLSDLDPDMHPQELEQLMIERLLATATESQMAGGNASAKTKRKRKPSKAEIERERLKQEVEEAKARDLKSLYKQLAKVLHPDLEPDASLKVRKEVWMKRLTTARAQGDLREMLAIEVEWLGQEAGNLAQATDDKLRVYSMVLKEQLAELKQHTQQLFLEPEFLPLRRFLSPYDDRLVTHIIKSQWIAEIDILNEMTSILRAGGAAARKLIVDSAERHARIFGY